MANDQQAFWRLADSVRQLFQQLRALSDTASGGVSASHRGVLQSLWADGPSTVPALARTRAVARQHIQVLVNELLAQRMIEALPNPAHKRSPLLGLTSAGKKRIAAIQRAEQKQIARLELASDARELSRLADRLEKLTTALRQTRGTKRR